MPTYEGDLMAAAGVSWTIGREGRKEFGESLAGQAVSEAEDGDLRLRRDGQTTAADHDRRRRRGRRRRQERDGLQLSPLPHQGPGEPRARFPSRPTTIRRASKSCGATSRRRSGRILLWDLYPLPGDKFDANNGIGKQFSMGLVGACNGWSEADAAGRAKIWEAHKQYTLELYHFLTTDPAVPEHLRRGARRARALPR